MEFIKAVEWQTDSATLSLLDQRDLPSREVYLSCNTIEEVIVCIREMVVRGAPAIGIAAAYGAVLSAKANCSASNWSDLINSDLNRLEKARPTAVNLMWAVEQARVLLSTCVKDNVYEKLLTLAKTIHLDDVNANMQMGESAIQIMKQLTPADKPFSVITHCNTGSLATGGYGTALGGIRSCWKAHMIDKVYADETRPWLQGARLTAWELMKDNIPVELNVDSAAAYLMKNKNIKWAIVGADRITANGDVANKIGTYSLAILAKYHGVRFMVVAPSSTVDMSLESGQQIDIEYRAGDELTCVGDKKVAPDGVNGINPVFDVTPAELIDVIVTEKGCIQSPSLENMKRIFCD